MSSSGSSAIFSWSGHSVALLSGLGKARNDKIGCDVDIACGSGGDDVISAHGAVLAAFSPFFAAKLSSSGDTGTIPMPEYSSEIVSILVDYMYAGAEIKVSLKNLAELTAAANELKIRGLCDDDDKSQSLAKIHLSALKSGLFKARKDGLGCDVKLICGGGGFFTAHSAVLTASSPYFADKFFSGASRRILMKKIDPEIVNALVTYMYAGEVKVSRKNLAKFLEAGNAFKISGLCDDDEDMEELETTDDDEDMDRPEEQQQPQNDEGEEEEEEEPSTSSSGASPGFSRHTKFPCPTCGISCIATACQYRVHLSNRRCHYKKELKEYHQQKLEEMHGEEDSLECMECTECGEFFGTIAQLMVHYGSYHLFVDQFLKEEEMTMLLKLGEKKRGRPKGTKGKK